MAKKNAPKTVAKTTAAKTAKATVAAAVVKAKTVKINTVEQAEAVVDCLESVVVSLPENHPMLKTISKFIDRIHNERNTIETRAAKARKLVERRAKKAAGLAAKIEKLQTELEKITS